MNRLQSAAAVLASTACMAGPLFSQQNLPPYEGGLTKSMGQPPQLKVSAGVSGGMYLEGDATDFTGYAQLGLFKDLMNPVTGGPGVKFEGYAGIRGSDTFDGGLRGLIEIPIFGLGGGVDYNVPDEAVQFIARLSVNLKRGGILAAGGKFRADWIPARGNSFNIGFTLPLNDSYRGRTRPRDTYAPMKYEPRPSPQYSDADSRAALESSLAAINQYFFWIYRANQPFMDQGGGNVEEALARQAEDLREIKNHMAETGLTLNEEISAFHAELDRAFSIAATGEVMPPGQSTPLGRRVAANLKRILLEEAIIPYNRLLGVTKKPNTPLRYQPQTDSAVTSWLQNESGVAAERLEDVFYAADKLSVLGRATRDSAQLVWSDSRLSWIPLQLMLTPDQYDTREELDSLLAKVVGLPFVSGNRVSYIVNAEFQLELARTIRRAEDYHVLWIHDIRGVNSFGDPDQVTYYQMVDGYLRTLTERVRQYDERGVLPMYIIIFDQHYYEINKSRRWMNLLERPLDYEMSFPNEYSWMAEGVRRAQEELREAIAASERLQADAGRFGEDWLKNLVKVHVNVTHPADDSFWSNQGLPILGYPDNIMRDHRKIAFYDITEEDPYKGAAIYSGMGIGEHYVGATWEDRAILARGPAILDMKTAARELLRGQGFSEDQIPYPLKAKPLAPDYDERIRRRIAEGWTTSALELHNRTGYHLKPINVFKAVLYGTLPAGSVINIPDSLWNSAFFASMLVGSCLRGVKVMIINPSKNNAPGQSFPTLSRAQELFARLITVQDVLGDEIDEAGGLLKTGLYDPEVDVADLNARVKLMAEGIRATPWLFELVDFHSRTWEVLDDIDEITAGYEVEHLTHEAGVERPRLHLKINFFSSGSVWSRFVSSPEFAAILREFMVERAQDFRERREAAQQIEANKRLDVNSLRDVEAFWQGVKEFANAELDSVARRVPATELERDFAYFIVGSSNQDYRSMLMDGEVMLAVKGRASLPGLLDILFLSGVSTWVDDLDALEELLPGYGGFKFKISRTIKTAL